MPEVVEARLGDEAGALILRTDDHPEARGRQPQPGDQEWTLSLVLEDGRTVGAPSWSAHPCLLTADASPGDAG
jgi:hypothetical protein